MIEKKETSEYRRDVCPKTNVENKRKVNNETADPENETPRTQEWNERNTIRGPDFQDRQLAKLRSLEEDRSR